MNENIKIKKCPHCIKEVDVEASRCPHCQGKIFVWTRGRKILAGFIIFTVFILVISGSSNSNKTPTTSSNTTSNTVTATGPQLELLSYNCDKEYGYFTISGQVKNISGNSLKNVTAVGSTYAKDKTFINSESTLIEYNPILPNQTSPFKVMMTENPQMSKCNVDFKYLIGGSIEFKDSSNVVTKK